MDVGTEPRSTVIPSLLRRCPECGHVGLRRRFAIVRDRDADGPRLVECPACGRRFEVVDDPRLQ